jgi:serine/threonine protein phosphatase PrpC
MPSPCDFELVSAMATHVGAVRRHNEDSGLDRREIGLWAVADGMGGHAAGEVASQLIINSLRAIAAPTNPSGFIAEVRTRLSDANLKLIEEAARRGTPVVGSTVVVLLAQGGFYACLWAGDSRLYRLRNGELVQLTRDHSQVWEMVEAGVLDEAAAERHSAANVITRAVGAQPVLVLDKVTDRLVPDDLFLLCTDGLSKMVPAREIAEILRSTPLRLVPQALIESALSHGGHDNITVLAVHVGAALGEQDAEC